MPTILTEERLKEAVKKNTFIVDGDPDGVEGIKYDFLAGGRILKANFSSPINYDRLSEEARGTLQVDPGEVVFVLTRERLALPQNMMAILSPKRGLAHRGIMVLGGLAVDPGYTGVLCIGLYNFATTPFPLWPGIKLIAGMFYELSETEAKAVVGKPSKAITDFPEELISLIRNYKPIELKGVQDALLDTRKQLEALKADITGDKQWRDDLRRSMDRHDQQLEALIRGLEKETEVRGKADDDIKATLSGMSNLFFGIRLATVGLIFVIGVVITAIVTVLITNAMTPDPPQATVIEQQPAVQSPVEER